MSVVGADACVSLKKKTIILTLTVEKCKSVFLLRLLKDEGGKVKVTVDLFSIGLHKK